MTGDSWCRQLCPSQTANLAHAALGLPAILTFHCSGSLDQIGKNRLQQSPVYERLQYHIFPALLSEKLNIVSLYQLTLSDRRSL